MEEFVIPKDLGDDCPLWVYMSDRILSGEDQKALQDQFAEFASLWSSHGRKVLSHFGFVAKRFMMLAADVEKGDISGCGIDASVRQLTQLASSRDIEWVSVMHVAYQNLEGNVEVIDRAGFRKLANSGAINNETVVYDPSISSAAQYRNGGFVKQVKDSWHKQLMPKELA